MNPEIIYEDKYIIVCVKPAGIATQSKKIGAEDMVSLLKKHLAEESGSSGEPYLAVIHRLDQPVEGVLVFAKNAAAAAILGKELKARQFAKYYYAIVTRENIPETGVLEDYVVKDGRKNRAMVVTESNPRAKKARLSYEVVKRRDDRSLLEIHLDNGRFHQIRVQLASRTAPILGDVKYGGSRTGEPLCRCSYRLQVTHPVSEEGMDFSIKPRGREFGDFFA